MRPPRRGLEHRILSPSALQEVHPGPEAAVLAAGRARGEASPGRAAPPAPGSHRRGTCILLATLDGEPFLREQLDSIAAQTDQDWMLLWRDDGSSDRTPALLDAFAARTGRDRVQRVPGGPSRFGPLGSFMALLAAAPDGFARYAFCDQDDVWLPGKLARAADLLAPFGSGLPALCCGRQILVDERLRPLGMSDLPTRPTAFGNAVTQNVASGCTSVLNAAARTAVLSAPAPPATAMHDWWTYLVVTGVGGPVVFDPAPMILYRQHHGNALGSASSRGARALRALQRGPDRYLGSVAANLVALSRMPRLTPAARDSVGCMLALTDTPRLRRAALVQSAGIYRQSRVDDAVMRAWLILRGLPTLAATLADADRIAPAEPVEDPVRSA